jgi:hypothetical protein
MITHTVGSRSNGLSELLARLNLMNVCILVVARGSKNALLFCFCTKLVKLFQRRRLRCLCNFILGIFKSTNSYNIFRISMCACVIYMYDDENSVVVV